MNLEDLDSLDLAQLEIVGEELSMALPHLDSACKDADNVGIEALTNLISTAKSNIDLVLRKLKERNLLEDNGNL